MLTQVPVIIKAARSSPRLLAIQDWLQSQPEWKLILAAIEKGAPGQPSPQYVINQKHQLQLEYSGKSLAFHPSMALLRLINLLRGESDRYLTATALEPGDTLLDATLGLAGDALVGAWAVGEKGRVMGLESSCHLTLLIRYGLLALSSHPLPQVKNQIKHQAWTILAQAARQIEVIGRDHLDYLTALPSQSVDVVYFDPMFRHTRKQSASIQPLHFWANPMPLSTEAVQAACRVARKRVVLKERKGSGEFRRLGFSVLSGGNYSPVDYGILSL